MSFKDDAPNLSMTPAERARTNVLIVESDSSDRNRMKSAIRQLGFGSVTDSPNHLQAIEKIGERPITHVIFEAKKTNMPAKEFLKKILEADPKLCCIPSSYEPNVDDVFDMLVMGAKGYLVKPFTVDTVESAVINSTKGEPISELVLKAKDRNEALVAIMMSSLDKAATVLRQAYKFDTAKRELPRAMAGFRRSAELAHTFAKGGDEELIAAMERFCIERSKGPATRLGRLRKRLKNKNKPAATAPSGRSAGAAK
ncbi:MAG: response regulator [Candidatus Dadabacteria bacterium]|nr:MAG: response regulator [Candidatus Dadabacteria bacterium]